MVGLFCSLRLHYLSILSLKSFVADCISNTPVFKHSCCLESKKDFCESFVLSSYEQKNTTLIVGYYEQNNVRDK